MAISLEDIKRAASTQRAAGVSVDELRAYGRNVGLTEEEIDYALGITQAAPTNGSDLQKALSAAESIGALGTSLGDKNVTGKEAVALSDPNVRAVAEAALRGRNELKQSNTDLARYGTQLGLNQDLIDYLLGDEMNLFDTGTYDIGANALAAIQASEKTPYVMPTVTGGTGVDTVTGGTGVDTVTGGGYQDTLEGGAGVDFKGSSGLREFYGPYVADYLSRMSGLLGLRDAKNYQPIKFGTAAKDGTYGADTAKTLADLQTQRENMMGLGASKTPAYQPFNYSFASDPTVKKAASGGIMSLVEGYADGGMAGGQTVPSTFTAPTGTYQQATYDPTKASGYVAPGTYQAGNIASPFNTSNVDLYTSPKAGEEISSGYSAPDNIYKAGNIGSTYDPKTGLYSGPGAGITTDTFDATALQRLMSPYMSGVVDPQVREAKRQAELARQTQAARFSQAGAFGGTRNILAENELGRNLATQIGDIYGKGQQGAFDAALRAFEAEQGRKLQAATTTEQARQEAGRQALTGAETEARLGLQAATAQEQAKQAAGQQALSAAQTAGQLGLQAATAQEQAKQAAGQQALSAAEIAGRLGLQGSELTERSRQFAAQYGLDVAKTSAQYDQQARELQQRAEEAQARGDQFGASLALQQLQEAQRAAEASRAFEYQQARDTYLDPFRELGYASQLLQGLPTSAAPTGVSPTADALKALLATSGVLFPGG